MYKLLIVEDEKWEREGLRDFLDWKSLGIEVAGCASNGIEGKRMAEEIQPHIIITDIKMPLVDGMQMSREIRAFLPQTYIIILTGYDEFDYAKQAFDFNAFAYLLKPLEKETLEKTILDVLNKLETREKHQNERISLENRWREYTSKNSDYLFLDFLSRKADLSYINEIPLFSRLKTYEKKVVAVFSVAMNPDRAFYEDRLSADMRNNVLDVAENVVEKEGIVLSCSEHVNEVIVCMDASSGESEIKRKLLSIIDELNEKAGVYSMAGTGGVVDETESLPGSYRQACKALEFRFLANYGEVLFYRDIMESARKSWNLTRELVAGVDLVSRKIVNSVLSGDINRGAGYVDEFLAKLREYPSESKILLNCFIMNIVNVLNMELPNNSDGVYVALFNPQNGMVDSSVLGSFEQTKKYLTGFLSRIAVNMKKDGSDSNVARTVLKIIEERYMEELTLKRISEEIHFYPYYIGSIFKEYTGKSFTQFLNDYRIDKAKEILDRKHVKISELAKAVGISNTSYFCSLFKERFGISPGEYVEIMGRRHVSV